MNKTSSLAVAAVATVLMAAGTQAASLQSPVPTTLPAVTVATADVMMVVSHSYAHLRKEANTKSDILATLKKGTKVDVIEKVTGGKWAHVKVDKLEGYVAISLLKAA